MNRRRFLSHTIAGAVGLVAGGAVLGSGELDRAELEHDDSAIPDGPARALGRRQLIWAVPTSAPLAALTFDDGPDPELTPRILAILARYDVRATFNLMGYNASRHRDLVRALVGGGHELGNHTWSHEDLAFQSPAATFRQLERGLIAVERAAGVPPRFFRPPRGELTGAALQAAAQLGHDVLLWSVTRGPAGVGTPRAVVDHMAVAIGPGDVVGLHDGIGRGTFDRGGVHARVLEARRRVELAALPAAIEAVLTRNLKLITATELLDAPATASPPDSGGA
jgi:peptidoglycan/xylan/chitin deacetylase (PgdA/CDA1 family)